MYRGGRLPPRHHRGAVAAGFSFGGCQAFERLRRHHGFHAVTVSALDAAGRRYVSGPALRSALEPRTCSGVLWSYAVIAPDFYKTASCWRTRVSRAGGPATHPFATVTHGSPQPIPQSTLQAPSDRPTDQGGSIPARDQVGDSAARDVESEFLVTTAATNGKDLKPSIPLAPIVIILMVCILLSSILGGCTGGAS